MCGRRRKPEPKQQSRGTRFTPSCPPLRRHDCRRHLIRQTCGFGLVSVSLLKLSTDGLSQNGRGDERRSRRGIVRTSSGVRAILRPKGAALAATKPGGDREPRMRNGGRHCCQPPLRRAKDLPVFDLPWSRPHEWVCNPASRSWLTSSGVASHLEAPSCEEPGCLT